MTAPRRSRAAAPALDALEARQLLTTVAPRPAVAAQIRIDDNAIRADIARMVLTSHVTQGEIGATRRIVAEINATHGPMTVTREAEAEDVAWQLERTLNYSVLESAYTDAMWAAKQTRIAAEFAKLGHPLSPALQDQLMANLEAIARSANVGPSEHNQFFDDLNKTLADEGYTAEGPGRGPDDPYQILRHHMRDFVQPSPAQR